MKPVTDLLTTGQMVKTLGVCDYYARDDMPRIKRFLETASR